MWCHAGGHDVPVPCSQGLAVDLQCLLVDEACVALQDREAVGVGDVGVLRLAQAVDQGLLLLHQGAQGDRARAGGDAFKGVRGRTVALPGGGEEVLAGHATDVQAGPA